MAVLPPLSHDRALGGILASNALALGLAWWAGDGLLVLLWPYWVQSVVIGFFAQRRIRRLREFSTEGMRINDEPVAATPATRRWTANFFVLHYGLFHVVYLMFLLGFTREAAGTGVVSVRNAETGEMLRFQVGTLEGFGLFAVGAAALSFLWSHLESHREHVAADLRGRPNLGTLMFLPYARIIPMHLTIIFGALLGGGTAGLLLFGTLKTGADTVMHIVEHRLLQRGRPA